MNMMMALEDVARVAGVEAIWIHNLIGRGIITPAEEGGPGRGQGHKFTLMQSVGLVVGAWLRYSERSCVMAYVGEVVKAFDAVTPEWLEAQLYGKYGLTHLVTIHKGKPLLAASKYDWPDFREAYELVNGKMSKQKREKAAK